MAYVDEQHREETQRSLSDLVAGTLTTGMRIPDPAPASDSCARGSIRGGSRSYRFSTTTIPRR